MNPIILHINHLDLVLDRVGSKQEPTILLLHAGGESRSVWSPIIERLTDIGWQIIAPDLRGHGQSERAESYLFDDFVLDAKLMIAELAGKPLVIVGGSIGGLIGLMITGMPESPVDGLILLDVPTAPALLAAQRENQKIADGIARGVVSLAHVDPRLVSSTLVQDILADSARLRQAARNVRVPTLLIRGQRSPAVGEMEQAAFTTDIPHGEIKMVNAGHLVARDQPGFVADTIRTFLAQHWHHHLGVSSPPH